MADFWHDSGPGGMYKVNWRRFAVLASGVITAVAAIRLAADAAGVPRGTPASALVAALSNFVMYLSLGLSTPWVVRGVARRPIWRRLLVLVPIAAVAAVMNYIMLINAL